MSSSQYCVWLDSEAVRQCPQFLAKGSHHLIRVKGQSSLEKKKKHPTIWMQRIFTEEPVAAERQYYIYLSHIHLVSRMWDGGQNRVNVTLIHSSDAKLGSRPHTFFHLERHTLDGVSI